MIYAQIHRRTKVLLRQTAEVIDAMGIEPLCNKLLGLFLNRSGNSRIRWLKLRRKSTR
jgi:hypothetical protein